MEKETIKDKLGNEIKPGCWLMYSCMKYDSTDIRIGKVFKVWRTNTYNKKNIPRINVRGIDEKEKFILKSGTLQFPERAVVLKEDQIPPIFIELMKGVEDEIEKSNTRRIR